MVTTLCFYTSLAEAHPKLTGGIPEDKGLMLHKRKRREEGDESSFYADHLYKTIATNWTLCFWFKMGKSHGNGKDTIISVAKGSCNCPL